MPFSTTLRKHPRDWLVGTVLVVGGVIHLLPGVGLLAPARLAALYGIAGLDADLLVLLRHRALLLALLGVVLLVAAVRRSWQRPALAAAVLSTVVFVLLAFAYPVSPEIHRVAMIDLVMLPLLLVGLLLTVRRAAPPAAVPAAPSVDVH
jgi:hypothetical protein